jgi:ankyrin repeat protein
LAADPNLLSAWGRRALHQALERDNPLRFVELMLDHGADPRLANGAGSSAIVVATRAGRADVLDLFARRGFDETLSGANALLAACARGDEQTARTLAQPGLVRLIEAEAPGTLADFAGAGNTAGVALLLDLGFDTSLPSSPHADPGVLTPSPTGWEPLDALLRAATAGRRG